MPMELISYDIFGGRGAGEKALVTNDLLFTCHAHDFYDMVYTGTFIRPSFQAWLHFFREGSLMMV